MMVADQLLYTSVINRFLALFYSCSVPGIVTRWNFVYAGRVVVRYLRAALVPCLGLCLGALIPSALYVLSFRFSASNPLQISGHSHPSVWPSIAWQGTQRD